MSFNYSPKIVTDGLVLCLDAANTKSYVSGSTAWNDLSRGGNNGTLINGPTFNSDNGGSIVLDGVDDYIDLGNNTNLRMGTGNFTINVWVKVISTTKTSPFINGIISCKNAPAAAAGYGIYFFTDGINANKLLWSTANGSTAVEIFTQDTIPEIADKWANITMVRESGSLNNGCYYINGVYKQIISSATIVNVDTSNNLTLGNTADKLSIYWNKGNYGIVQIYNRALSSSEVLQNYNATKTRFGL
jgi:hypothetical protein